jgi:hypothetical protein
MSKTKENLDERIIALPSCLETDSIYRGYIIQSYDKGPRRRFINSIFERCVIIFNAWDFKSLDLVRSNYFFDCMIIFGCSMSVDAGYCEAQLKKSSSVRNCEIFLLLRKRVVYRFISIVCRRKMEWRSIGRWLQNMRRNM